MKLPSLSKLPSHKRFDFEPRHYDPILEEIEEKSDRAKRLEHFRNKKEGSLYEMMETRLERKRKARKNSIHRLTYVMIIMTTMFAIVWLWLNNLI